MKMIQQLQLNPMYYQCQDGMQERVRPGQTSELLKQNGSLFKLIWIILLPTALMKRLTPSLAVHIQIFIFLFNFSNKKENCIVTSLSPRSLKQFSLKPGFQQFLVDMKLSCGITGSINQL
jgi:hypothetical protein